METASIETVKQRFDEIAQIYADTSEKWTNITAFTMFTFIELSKAKSVLEAGCGPGGAAVLALKQIQQDTRFCMIDLSPKMIEIAQKAVLDNWKGNVLPECIEEGDATHLRFENASFDRIFSNYVLHLVPDPNAVLKEARRLVKPGGIAIWSMWGRPENSPVFTIAMKAKAAIGLHGDLPPPFHLSDIEKTKQMVKDAGFDRVVGWYQVMSTNICPTVLHVVVSHQMPDILTNLCKNMLTFVASKTQILSPNFDDAMIEITSPVPEKNFLQTLDNETKKKYLAIVESEVRKILDNGHPMYCEALIVAGYVN